MFHIKLFKCHFDMVSLDKWQYGVDANSTDRVLLRSSKPTLHTNIDCNALVAAVVSRQVSVVRLLLQVKLHSLCVIIIDFLRHYLLQISEFHVFCDNTLAIKERGFVEFFQYIPSI